MNSHIRPLLLGLEGYKLTSEERAFLRDAPPMGFILFARNIDTVEQTRDLCAELAEFSPFSFPLIAVDQEGGRVQRVKFGGKLPPANIFGEWFLKSPQEALEGVYLNGFLLAAQLRNVGANWLLGPLIDVANNNTHAIIGNRSFSSDSDIVITIAREYARGVNAGGCLRCLKHAPGHGRALVDSHVELPHVDASLQELAIDMKPFQAMAPSEDFLMTAHIKYDSLDASEPASYSRTILNMMRNEWNFKGLVLADDVGMKALEGSYDQRILKSLNAGCDVAITALSVLKHGMAGTYFDRDNFEALSVAQLPDLNNNARNYLSNLLFPKAPSDVDVSVASMRLKELWADGPERLGYALEL